LVSVQNSILIVGAGVIGMLTALELRRRGWSVRIFDRAAAGGESSWAGGGILSPILPWNYPEPIWTLSRRSLALYPVLADELVATTEIDPELTPSGALVLDGDHDHDRSHDDGRDQALAWCAREGRTVRRWSGPLRAGSPAAEGLSLPWIGQIRNPRLCKALVERLRQSGVWVHEHEPVLEWRSHNGRILGLRTTRANYSADAVVLAAGAWSGQLDRRVPVSPVRGQMLLLSLEPGELQSIVLDSGRYLIPRRDGRVLVGSTVEPVGFDRSVDSRTYGELLGFAMGLLGHDVAQRVEAHWAGLRPGSADELPLIGEHPQLRGLYLNTGHYRNGLIMGPASAELLADQLSGQTPKVDAALYWPTMSRLLE
jgi:glycine oxidase